MSQIYYLLQQLTYVSSLPPTTLNRTAIQGYGVNSELWIHMSTKHPQKTKYLNVLFFKFM